SVGGFGILGGQAIVVDGVEGEERGADEEEDGGYGDVEEAAEPHTLGGFLVVLGSDVALHVVLVDAEVGEVDEDAVEQHDPEGALGEGGTKAAEAELIVFSRDGYYLAEAL